jgi:S1-C subfamily serine protease
MALRRSRPACGIGLLQTTRLWLLIVVAIVSAVWALPAVISQADSSDVIPPSVSRRIGQALADRHVDQTAKWPGGASRGLRDLFRETVSAVPLVIARDGIGSSAVVRVDRSTGAALLVTNHHVVESPFVSEDKSRRFVVVVFHEPSLATTVFDYERVTQCLVSSDRSSWCSTLRGVTRLGAIVASDQSRDLALVVIQGVPEGVRSIPWGVIDTVKPGDDVVVIGHPLGLLWSVTTGIVSAIRSNYRVSASPTESTVVQTQTPVNPGNSGGPLLTSEGRLVGIIFGSPTVRASRQKATEDVRVAAPGLNLAIGVNEVQGLISRTK